MKHSDSTKSIIAALAKVQGEVEDAAKDKENPHLKSRYADLKSIWHACRAALSAHGIAIVQGPIYGDGKAGVVTFLGHGESGEWFEDELLLPVTKNDAQGVGSAITYARRYALAAMVGVVADEDDDGNGAAGVTGSKEAAKRVGEEKLAKMKQASPNPTPTAPAKAAEPKPSTGTTKNFSMLEAFAEIKKKIGDSNYYRILGANGFEKSNQILERDRAVKIYHEMGECLKAMMNEAEGQA